MTYILADFVFLDHRHIGAAQIVGLAHEGLYRVEPRIAGMIAGQIHDCTHPPIARNQAEVIGRLRLGWHQFDRHPLAMAEDRSAQGLHTLIAGLDPVAGQMKHIDGGNRNRVDQPACLIRHSQCTLTPARAFASDAGDGRCGGGHSCAFGLDGWTLRAQLLGVQSFASGHQFASSFTRSSRFHAPISSFLNIA